MGWAGRRRAPQMDREQPLAFALRRAGPSPVPDLPSSWAPNLFDTYMGELWAKTLLRWSLFGGPFLLPGDDCDSPADKSESVCRLSAVCCMKKNCCQNERDESVICYCYKPHLCGINSSFMYVGHCSSTLTTHREMQNVRQPPGYKLSSGTGSLRR